MKGCRNLALIAFILVSAVTTFTTQRERKLFAQSAGGGLETLARFVLPVNTVIELSSSIRIRNPYRAEVFRLPFVLGSAGHRRRALSCAKASFSETTDDHGATRPRSLPSTWLHDDPDARGSWRAPFGLPSTIRRFPSYVPRAATARKISYGCRTATDAARARAICSSLAFGFPLQAVPSPLHHCPAMAISDCADWLPIKAHAWIAPALNRAEEPPPPPASCSCLPSNTSSASRMTAPLLPSHHVAGPACAEPSPNLAAV